MVSLSLVGIQTVDASSATTYTRTFDRKGNFVITQDAYLPDQTILDLQLDSPSDIFIDSEDKLYIADTKNARIVKYDPDIDEITLEILDVNLVSPKGVFVDDDGLIYVADSGAHKIIKFASDGSLIEFFEKPTSVSFAEKPFDPKKIAVDDAGNMFVIGEGVFDGIIQLSSNGTFLGYFATNDVQLTLRQRLENLLFTEEQLEQTVDRNPIVFSNIFVDNNNRVYSTSIGLGIHNVKKHNTDGSSAIDTNYGIDLESNDVYTDDQGIIYASSQSGLIHVFTSDGMFIFAFGTGEDDEDISGFYSNLTSIAVDSEGKIWTLDENNAFLQSYTPTEYSTKIYDALTLYNNGKYDEAVEVWNDVLKLNQLSVLAHNEIGRNLFSQGNYEESMEHFILSGNRYYYSEAYWEVRNVSIQETLPVFLLAVFLFVVGFISIKQTDKRYHYLDKPKAWLKSKSEIPFIDNILFAFAFVKHPLDSFYYLKKKRRGSYLGASIWWVLFFVSYMIYQTSKGFIFQYVEAVDMDLNALVLGFFSIAILFVLSNYLVTSINDGEGSIGELYKGIGYSLMPVTLIYALATYLSHVLTLNESFILEFTSSVGLAVSGLFVFLAIQELHNYTIRETIKSLLMTILFMAIVAILFAFIQIMGDQLIQFIIALVKEAFRNVFS
jgi:sugar lactone lactonase YvrE